MAAFVVFNLVVIALSTPANKPYRVSAQADQVCRALSDQPKLLFTGVGKTENNEMRLLGAGASCWLQRHEVPSAPTSSAAGAGALAPVSYTLGFVEFAEDGRPLSEKQREAVLNLLRDNTKQRIVITFLHGWRHDASVGDGDVMGFRRLLAYAASFARQRCEADERRYCGVEIVGIFLGWRGRSFVDCKYFFCDAFAALTFWSRKQTSERIAPGVTTFLKTVDRIVRGPANAAIPNANKLLIVGHSFGGNVLATGLEQDFIQAIQRHRPGEQFRAPVGDLVLLLNPASEASKWISLQHEIIRRRQVAPAALFGPQQRPVYVSLTSACAWNRKEKDLLRRKIRCDVPTAYVFRLGYFFRLDADRHTTIGHYLSGATGFVGASHELEINGTAGKNTAYGLANAAAYSQCMIADGWLTRAKARPGQKAPAWDGGDLTFAVGGRGREAYAQINNVLLDVKHGEKYLNRVHGGINGQFRNGLYRNAAPVLFPAIAGANDPLWNVRALDTAVIGHNGFVSYPMWCAVSQLLLDDVTAVKP